MMVWKKSWFPPPCGAKLEKNLQIRQLWFCGYSIFQCFGLKPHIIRHQHVRHPSYFIIIFYSLNLTCLQEVIRRICIDGISDSIFYGPYGDYVALSFFKASVLTLSTHVRRRHLQYIYIYFYWDTLLKV